MIDFGVNRSLPKQGKYITLSIGYIMSCGIWFTSHFNFHPPDIIIIFSLGGSLSMCEPLILFMIIKVGIPTWIVLFLLLLVSRNGHMT